MDVTHLRYFVAVIDAGSLSGAAGSLHVSQPALSQRMAQLERDLGVVRLLERGPRGVRATAVGQELYRDAHRLLRQFDQIARGLAERQPLRALVDRTFAARGIAPTVVADVESLATMLEIAESGDACAILPVSTVEPGREGLAVRRIVEPVVERHVSLCRARELSAPEEAVTAVEGIVAEVVRRLAADGSWPGIRLAEEPEQ